MYYMSTVVLAVVCVFSADSRFDVTEFVNTFHFIIHFFKSMQKRRHIDSKERIYADHLHKFKTYKWIKIVYRYNFKMGL
jgi:hypothetical protein